MIKTNKYQFVYIYAYILIFRTNGETFCGSGKRTRVAPTIYVCDGKQKETKGFVSRNIFYILIFRAPNM